MSVVEHWLRFPGSLWSLQSWRYSNLAGHHPEQPAAADPSRSTGLDQRLVPASLSNFVILWFIIQLNPEVSWKPLLPTQKSAVQATASSFRILPLMAETLVEKGFKYRGNFLLSSCLWASCQHHCGLWSDLILKATVWFVMERWQAAGRGGIVRGSIFLWNMPTKTRAENLGKVEAGRNPQLEGGREKEPMSFILNICTNHGTEEKQGWETAAGRGRADRGADDYCRYIY